MSDEKDNVYDNGQINKGFKSRCRNFKSVQTSLSTSDFIPTEKSYDCDRKIKSQDNLNSALHSDIQIDRVDWAKQFYSEEASSKILHKRMQKLARKLLKPGGEDRIKEKLQRYIFKVYTQLYQSNDDTRENNEQIPVNLVKKLKRLCLKSTLASQPRIYRLEIPKHTHCYHRKKLKSVVSNWLKEIPVSIKDQLERSMENDDLFELVLKHLEPHVYEPSFKTNKKSLLKVIIEKLLRDIPIALDVDNKETYLSNLTISLMDNFERFYHTHQESFKSNNINSNLEINKINEFVVNQVAIMIKKLHLNITTRRLMFLEGELSDAITKYIITNDGYDTHMTKNNVYNILYNLIGMTVCQARYFASKILQNAKEKFIEDKYNHGTKLINNNVLKDLVPQNDTKSTSPSTNKTEKWTNDYKEKVKEQIEEWFLESGVNFDEELLKNAQNNLAEDIVDRCKYLELNPVSRGTDEHELLYLKYQIFKWTKTLVGLHNMQDIINVKKLRARLDKLITLNLIQTTKDQVKVYDDVELSESTCILQPSRTCNSSNPDVNNEMSTISEENVNDLINRKIIPNQQRQVLGQRNINMLDAGNKYVHLNYTFKQQRAIIREYEDIIDEWLDTVDLDSKKIENRKKNDFINDLALMLFNAQTSFVESSENSVLSKLSNIVINWFEKEFDQFANYEVIKKCNVSQLINNIKQSIAFRNLILNRDHNELLESPKKEDEYLNRSNSDLTSHSYVKQLSYVVNDRLEQLQIPKVRDMKQREIITKDLYNLTFKPSSELLHRIQFISEPKVKNCDQHPHNEYQKLSVDTTEDKLDVPASIFTDNCNAIFTNTPIITRNIQIVNQVPTLGYLAQGTSLKEDKKKPPIKRQSGPAALGIPKSPRKHDESNRLLDELSSLPHDMSLRETYQYFGKIFMDNIQELPLETPSSEQDVLASLARTAINNGIWKTYFALKGNPEIEDDYDLFEFAFEQRLDDMLDCLPQTEPMKHIRAGWKSKIIYQVILMLKYVHNITDPPTFRELVMHKLNRKWLKDYFAKENDAYQHQFVAKVAEDFIILSKYNESDPIKSNIYKQRLMKRLEELAEEVKKQNNVNFGALNMAAMCQMGLKVLESVPIPHNNALDEEVHEILTADEIRDWYKALPLKPIINEDERMLRDRLCDILAKRVCSLEKQKEHLGDPTLDTDMKREVSRFLQKDAGLLDVNDLNLNYMVEELTNRLKNRREQNYLAYESFEKDKPFSSTFAQVPGHVLAPLVDIQSRDKYITNESQIGNKVDPNMFSAGTSKTRTNEYYGLNRTPSAPTQNKILLNPCMDALSKPTHTISISKPGIKQSIVNSHGVSNSLPYIEHLGPNRHGVLSRSLRTDGQTDPILSTGFIAPAGVSKSTNRVGSSVPESSSGDDEDEEEIRYKCRCMKRVWKCKRHRIRSYGPCRPFYAVPFPCGHFY